MLQTLQVQLEKHDRALQNSGLDEALESCTTTVLFLACSTSSHAVEDKTLPLRKRNHLFKIIRNRSLRMRLRLNIRLGNNSVGGLCRGLVEKEGKDGSWARI